MSRTSSTVARTTTRPSLADMKAALASRSPAPADTSSDPLGIVLGRSLSNVPKFFDAVVTSYRFHRDQ